MTKAETLLWSRLRGKKLNGLKYRRQQVIDGFIADFFCSEKSLVIEVDGPIHDRMRRKQMDEHRSKVFESRGIRVLRVKNEDVVHRMEDVLQRIVMTVDPIPRPLSRIGEGE
jgi:very-short-patch-repair endonuclease